MALSSGTRFCAYEIAGEIGAGGMGVVYRATDTKLDRDVAIKVLPESMAADAERLSRFDREAKTLASLNHPNIAQIYGIEESEGTTALILELVEGPTLAERIAQGALSADEAQGIALQIAEALEAAHSQGIVHRDLKPANIKLRPDGTVKVLDFGIAKALEPDNLTTEPQSPILTTPATQVGVILGTAAYMSPEQAKGQSIDQRADIWAFGCLLYEMLTGQMAFGAEDVPTTLARVIDRDTDLDSLPASVSPPVRQTIKLCLQKDVKKRVRDIGDVRLGLEGAFESAGPIAVAAAAVAVPPWRRALPVVAAVLVTGAVVGLGGELLWSAPEQPLSASSMPVRRSYHQLGSTAPISNTALSAHLALSPDGRRLVYAAEVDGTTQLYVRELDQLEARPLQNTDGAQHPFFSPDGEWVAFFADETDSELKRVAFRGGPARTLTEIAGAGGGFWGQDDRIIYSTNPDGVRSLFSIPANGGEPEFLIDPEPEGDGHVWPAALPGGNAILFVLRPGGNGPIREGRIAVLSLESREYRVLIEGAHRPQYVPTGHIVFVRSGALWAASFDAERLEITGPEVPIVDAVQQNGNIGGAAFTFSDDGFLVFLPGTDSSGGGGVIPKELVWVDRQGGEERLAFQPRNYWGPRLSPDGRQLAIGVGSGNDDIFVNDLERGTSRRLTFAPGEVFGPHWTSDSQRVVFWSAPENEEGGLFWQAADGSGQAERLTTSAAEQLPGGFSPDGTRLVFSQWDGPSSDVYVLSLDGEHTSQPLLNEDFFEGFAAISPGGRWIAYSSGETGQAEIFVRHFPNVDDGKWQVSVAGGTDAHWGAEGTELFFRDGDAMLVVSIEGEADSALVAGTPEVLFRGSYWANPNSRPNYDVTPDGQRLLMMRNSGMQDRSYEQTLLFAVENWFEELVRLAPTGE